MMLKKLALAGVISLMGTSAFAACSYQNETEGKMLSAGFEAWKAVTGHGCGDDGEHAAPDVPL